MQDHHACDAAVGDTSRRLCVYNGGFFNRRVHRILTLAGWRPRLGPILRAPAPNERIGVWGQSPTAHRGETIAARHNTPILRIEDAFLRSLFPGRAGEAPIGLMIDDLGVHFDASCPSRLEKILLDHPLDDAALLARARAAMARIQEGDLSKYSGFDPDLAPPAPGYVLVIDQTKGDASVRASKGDRARFQEMLYYAQEENPGATVLIKTHPETEQGYRAGHYIDADKGHRVRFITDPISPWALLNGAIKVYTLSSQMGFEAILAGHKPRVFGQPFYAGWGLTEDEMPVDRRQRRLTRAQLFAAAMILYPTWYDPYRDALCEIEDVLDGLEARVRAWREDRHGWQAARIRLWKRAHMQRFFGAYKKMRFADDLECGCGEDARRKMVWASQAEGETGHRIEDGFLRSRGLGAKLVPPMSLVVDDLGIYYDPTGPSRLEHWIEKRATLRPDQHRRSEDLIRDINTLSLSKYNLGGDDTPLPEGHLILVPGQVSDDASVRIGTDEIADNAALLRHARTHNPDAVILYKPHPDVVAGLRDGAIDAMAHGADLVVPDGDIARLLHRVEEVWTMTSLTGFEALLRGRKVTVLGAPFYAGWGLTTDLGHIPARRRARPSLEGLVHATLIDYPRYFDPQTGMAAPVEVILERLAQGRQRPQSNALKWLAKAQGAWASLRR